MSLLQNALSVMELNGLKSAVAAAASMNPPFTPAILNDARREIKRLEDEMACKAELNAAIQAKDLAKLVAAIGKAAQLNFSCSELDQAVSLKERIEQENALLQATRDACGRRNMSELNDFISQCVELGIEQRDEVAQARAIVREIEEELRKKAEMEAEEAKREEARRAAEAERERQRQIEAEALMKRDKVKMDADRALSDAIDMGDVKLIKEKLNVAMQMGLNTENVKRAQVNGYFMFSRLSFLIMSASKLIFPLLSVVRFLKDNLF